jgi:phage gp29-like protein
MSLVDRFGKEIKTGKPITHELAGVSAVRDRYSTYPSQGLTPGRLASIFKESDQGEILRQAELFEEMEEKDAHLGSVLQTRKLAVAGLPWEVVAASEEAEDRKIAGFVKEALEWVENWDDALLDIMDAAGKGFSVCEVMWEIAEKKVWCKALKWRHQKKFTFYDKDTVLEVPRLITDSEPVYGEELPSFKFVVHRYKARSGSTPRGGLLRPCAWMYLFKNYTVKDWVVFAERFAMPMRVGKYQPGASAEERRVLRNAVFNLGSDAAAVISDSTVVELLEQSTKTGSVQVFEKLGAFCDTSMSKAVLGHSASSESTPGRLGAEHEARDVRRDLLEADAKALAKTVTMQLVYPLVVYNFGPEKSLPRFRFHHEEGEDLEKTAKVYRALAEMGLPIGENHVREKFGVPAPEKDEEVITPRGASPLPSKRTNAGESGPGRRGCQGGIDEDREEMRDETGKHIVKGAA